MGKGWAAMLAGVLLGFALLGLVFGWSREWVAALACAAAGMAALVPRRRGCARSGRTE